MDELETTIKSDHFDYDPLMLLEHTDDRLIAEILIKMNGFVSIEAAEKLTTLDKTTQYRERVKGRFPKPQTITHLGRRKAYRIQDLIKWSQNPAEFASA